MRLFYSKFVIILGYDYIVLVINEIMIFYNCRIFIYYYLELFMFIDLLFLNEFKWEKKMIRSVFIDIKKWKLDFYVIYKERWRDIVLD